MNELTPATVIHFYDVRVRETLCGLRGFQHRSTKNARGVNCPACMGLLRRPANPAVVPDQDGTSAASA